MAAGWLYEPVHADVRDAWWLHQIRCDVRTPYQHVQIADTKLGTTLFCDSNVQSAELGQLHFHEAECVPAMSLADRPTRALVIGCSEGTVPLILAEAGFDLVEQVDLDGDCVALCAEHLPYGFTHDDVRAAERGDGPVRLRYGDGVAHVREAHEAGRTYDLIVLDLPEEHAETDGGKATGRGFLERCRGLLAPGGVLSTHVSRPYISLPTADSAGSLQDIWRAFGEVFGTRVYFRSPEQPWTAIMLGRPDEVDDPVGRMIAEFDHLPYKPRTLEAADLRPATHLPRVLRG